MTRFWPAVIFASLQLAIGQTGAQAQSCAPTGSGFSSRGGTAGTQIAQLQRQLAAIRAIERKRQCGAENALGGLFNACRDLAGQRRKVEAELGALGGRANCGNPAQRQKKTSPSKSSGLVRGNAVFYCVRLADGYLFPAPNSQFVGRDAADVMLRQCQYICEDPAMDVYVLRDTNLDTEQIISVRNETGYSELPRAFRYRSAENFQKCDWNRYVNRVHELQLSSAMSEEMVDVSVPLPVTRPQPEENGISTEATASIEKDAPLIDRPVRIIGPAFLPPPQ